MSDNLNKRSTSHAKSVDLDREQTALDRTQALREEFERAKTAQEPAREQDNTRQLEKTQGRTTSHAKTVDLDARKNAIDRAKALRDQFNRAKAAQRQAPEQEKAGQAEHAQSGSKMVKDDAPRHTMNPPSARREEPDRQAYNRDLKQEHASEDRKQRILEASKEWKNRVSKQMDRDKDLDHDR